MLKNVAEFIKDRCRIKPVGKRHFVIQPEDFVTTGVMLAVPSTLFTCSVTLNDGFRSSKLCFPLLQNGDANPHFPGLVRSSVTHTVPDLE